MSVLRTLVSSSRALASGAKDVARFREIASVFVRHGFGWVFSQLKLRRELQVEDTGTDLSRSTILGPDTGVRLVAACGELGPSFVKLGQILSTRPDLLPETITTELTKLQDQVDPLEFAAIDASLRRNLGADYRSRFASLDETPLASASIAQVHRAVLLSGQEVVLKVQRPGVRPKIESDVNILYLLAGYAEEAFDEASAMNLRGVVTDFAKSISQELDFRIEAQNLERFRRNFADNTSVAFPRVHAELSTTEVLCMDFIRGKKFSEWNVGALPPEQIEGIVGTYFDMAYTMLFRHGFFHGDLHPGNVLLMDDGKLGVLDCGMVGRLSPSMKGKVIDILYAILNEDLEAVARTFHALALPQERVDYPAFEADVIAIAEQYLVGVPLSEIQIGELLAEIVRGATKHRLRIRTDFTMMFKAILTTEGLAKSIAPTVDPLARARPFITEMVTERYSLDRLKQTAVADLAMLSEMLRALPHVLPGVLQDLQDGKVAVGLSPSTLRTQQRAEDRRTRRKVAAWTATGLIATGAYLAGLPLPAWPALALPYLTAVFWALGLALALFALW